MAAPDSIHPTDQTLRAYGVGKLYGALAKSVHWHLSGCGECRDRVAEMFDDTFLRGLRDAKAGPDSPAPVRPPFAAVSMTEGSPSSIKSPPAGSLPPGLAELADYELLGELGQGGMGVVYLAENKLMGRKEVLKVVSRELMNRRAVLDRFLREIRNAAQLHHPNIVTAYSAIRAGEGIVFAMEYVEGYDLAQLVKGQGPLPVGHACNFIYQAALGLQYAHQKGMVHRDIKPSNLMLAREDRKPVVKVLDFGLAKATREGPADGALTHEGQMLGTPDYIAPEQSLDAQKADIRADIYSLGCTLYYLLSGSPPFQGSSLYEILQAHHSTEARPLNLVRPEVPWELAAVVAKMMAKEPVRRYQAPGEVAKALKPFFKAGEEGPATSAAEISQESQPAPTQPETQPRPREKELARRGAKAVEPSTVKAPSNEPAPDQDRIPWRSIPAGERPESRMASLLGTNRIRRGFAVGALALLVVASLIGVLIATGRKKPASGTDRLDSQPGGSSADKQPPGPLKGQIERFVPLFNGKDLTGWRTHPSQPGNWRINNGILVGSGPATSHLYTERADYKDFHLRVEARTSGGDSGVYFRAPFGPVFPTNGPRFPTGFQAQIYDGRDEREGKTGSLFGGNFSALVVRRESPVPAGQWFTLGVIANGKQIVIKVNGETTAEYTDEKRLFSSGCVALQQLDETTVAEFRKIEIKELLPESGAWAADGTKPRLGFAAQIPEKDRGKWYVNDGCLEQTSLTDRVWITFGEEIWSDYDFSLEFRKVAGINDLEVAFRLAWENGVVGHPSRACVFGLHRWRNSVHTIEAWGSGETRWRSYGHQDATPPADNWMRARVRVRGAHAECFLNDQKLFDCDIDVAHPTGRVGLMTWGGSFRVRNIKVIAPDGKVLLEGLPKLDSPSFAE